MELDPHIAAQAKVAIASFFGGMVRLFLRPAASIGQSLALVACCVLLGFYFTPLVMDYFELPEEWSGGIGALIGLIGLSVAEGAVHFKYGRIADYWLNRNAPKEGSDNDQKQSGS